MRSLALLFAVPFFAVASGCGDDSSGGGGGGGGSPTGPTCTLAGENCFVATGATFTPSDLTTFQTACVGWGGTFASSGTCSVASTVTGYCAVPTAAAQALIGAPVAGVTLSGYYYTPLYNATTAGTDCTGIGGTWTGGGGGGGGGSVTIRCNFASAATCDEVTGAMTAADLTALSGMCTGFGGTYAVASCPTASAVAGRCVDVGAAPSSGASIAVATRYYTPTWNATTAAADCGAPLVP